MRKLRLYWAWSRPNFGDAMSPLVCERLAGRPVVYAGRWWCDLVAIGSLLNRFREGCFHPRVHVWGTGFIRPRSPRPDRLRYDAVRGSLSAEIIGHRPAPALGDPGLLADLLWPEVKKTPKRHRVGLVPHYIDRADPRVATLAHALPGCTVINVFDPVPQVLRQIAACECILSSSLHGLVAADAFGIPNAWLKLTDKVKGNGFKFRDYYSLFGPAVPAVAWQAEQIDPPRLRAIQDQYTRPALDDIKQRLLAAFPFKP